MIQPKKWHLLSEVLRFHVGCLSNADAPYYRIRKLDLLNMCALGCFGGTSPNYNLDDDWSRDQMWGPYLTFVLRGKAVKPHASTLEKAIGEFLRISTSLEIILDFQVSSINVAITFAEPAACGLRRLLRQASCPG